MKLLERLENNDNSFDEDHIFVDNNLVTEVLGQLRQVGLNKKNYYYLEKNEILQKQIEISSENNEIATKPSNYNDTKKKNNNLNTRSILSLSKAPNLDSYEHKAIRTFYEDRLKNEYNKKNINNRRGNDLKPTISVKVQRILAIRKYFKTFCEIEQSVASINFEEM